MLRSLLDAIRPRRAAEPKPAAVGVSPANGQGKPVAEGKPIYVQPQKVLDDGSIVPADDGCPYCAALERLRTEGNGDPELKAMRASAPKGQRFCDRCQAPIPNYVAMGGAGFQSHSADHYHAETVEGLSKPMTAAIRNELCHKCYLEDFAKVYPGHELPKIVNVTGSWVQQERYLSRLSQMQLAGQGTTVGANQPEVEE